MALVSCSLLRSLGRERLKVCHEDIMAENVTLIALSNNLSLLNTALMR